MRHTISALFMSASALCLAHPALAQSQAAPDPQAPEAAGADDAGTADIVVTGTRIVRDGYSAPTPVTVATVEDLVKATPTNIPDALNKLPQFQNSSSPSRSAHNFANTSAHGNVLNLRGVGGLRTLVLLDGQRVPPTTYLGTVDVNIVPNLLVQRVDIVTGGASAAYGSDAVSGVVNFVLNRSFTGITGVAQAGASERGDNGNYRLGIAGGMSFADGRGHLLLSAETFSNDGMLRSERALGLGGYSYVGSVPGCVNPTPAATPTACNAGGTLNPYTLASNVKLIASSEYGKITAGPFTNFRFTETGALVPFVSGTLTGTNGYAIGGDGYQISPETQAVAPLKTYQGYARASFDFTPDITGYVQGTFTRSDLNYVSLANSLVAPQGATLFSGNPYLPAEIQAAFTPAAQSISLSKYGASAPRPHTDERTDFWMVTAGLDGRFGDWRWNVAYNHGDSKHSVAQRGVWDWRNFYAAVDAVRDPSGAIVCRATLDADPAIRARYAGCRPFNVLLSGDAYASQPGYSYVVGTSQYQARTKQDSFTASLQGALFDLPAGPVDLAVGAEYRRQTLDLVTNADPSLLDTATERNAYFGGLRGVAPASLFYWLTNVGSAHGKLNVKEAFAEIAVPVLKDTPFFQELSLNAAGRYTDYSTSGSVKTWKLGATWKPVNDLLLRGSLSRDIRAPNLFELFAGDQSAISLLVDPVSGVSANVPQISGGNPNLKPERADTLTFGAVATPAFLPGFSLAVDYYRIKIKGAIGTLSLAQIVNNCSVSGGTAPECALITRPSPNAFPTQIRVAPANIAFLETSGIDFDATYRTELGSGNLGVRLYASYLEKFQTQQSATAPVLEYAGITTATSTPEGRPKWRGSISVNYEIGNVGVFVNQQVIGKVKIGIPGQLQNGLGQKVGAVTYTDLTLNYKVPAHGGNLEFFTTVNNLFDKQPPLIPGTIPGVNIATNFALYDIVGRAFTAGARFKF
jgi:outer membrane receptor protein involved in Fe transport